MRNSTLHIEMSSAVRPSAARSERFHDLKSDLAPGAKEALEAHQAEMGRREAACSPRPRPVAPASVPSCLRHDSAEGVLEDARNLAAFLEEAMDGMFASDFCPSNGSRMGMSLTFSLLQDKLNIALGNLAFPLVEHGADAVLWNPEQREGGDE